VLKISISPKWDFSTTKFAFVDKKNSDSPKIQGWGIARLPYRPQRPKL